MQFIYTGIRVQDLKRSIKFYTETMEMKEVRRGKMEAGGIWVELKSKGSDHPLELNCYPPGNKFCEKYVSGSELDHLASRVMTFGKAIREHSRVVLHQRLNLGMKVTLL